MDNKYALIEGGVVTHVIYTGTPVKSFEEYPDALVYPLALDSSVAIGCAYDAESDNFEAPVIEGNIDPGTEPEPIADWLTFRLTIFQDAAYQAITLAAHPLIAGRFETAVMADPPYLPLFPALWAGILQSSPSEAHPTAADYQAWTALAESCHVGFSWTSEGVIALAS
jgi:hypothetical protein